MWDLYHWLKSLSGDEFHPIGNFSINSNTTQTQPSISHKKYMPTLNLITFVQTDAVGKNQVRLMGAGGGWCGQH